MGTNSKIGKQFNPTLMRELDRFMKKMIYTIPEEFKMKTWVNLYHDRYDDRAIYTSISYATEQEAKDSIRKSMRNRYISTVNLANIKN